MIINHAHLMISWVASPLGKLTYSNPMGGYWARKGSFPLLLSHPSLSRAIHLKGPSIAWISIFKYIFVLANQK